MKDAKTNLAALYLRSTKIQPSKGDQLRFAILQAALKCLTDESILELNFQHIAKELKIRRSHVVYYYPTVHDLVSDLLERLLSVGQSITVAHLSSVQDPKLLLEAYVEATFLWFRLHPDHARALFLTNHFASPKSPHRYLLTAMRESAEGRIASILSKQQVRKKRSKAWIDQKASDIRSLLMGNLLNHFTTDSKVSYDVLEQRTIASVKDLANAP